MAIKGLLFLFIFVVCPAIYPSVMAQESPAESSSSLTSKPALVRAVMCEDVVGKDPKDPAIAFSVDLGSIVCFTSFDPVPDKTVIYHHWFFRDESRTNVKLTLKSPKWVTFSRITLRESEKGPWRVEITDINGSTLKVLRFSVVD